MVLLNKVAGFAQQSGWILHCKVAGFVQQSGRVCSSKWPGLFIKSAE